MVPAKVNVPAEPFLTSVNAPVLSVILALIVMALLPVLT